MKLFVIDVRADSHGAALELPGRWLFAVQASVEREPLPQTETERLSRAIRAREEVKLWPGGG